jgi:ATP/maltotriose-dependent transcriptional regulator MalT
LDQCQALVYIAAGDVVRAERLVHALPASPTRSLLAARAGLMRQPVLTRRTLDAVPPTTPRVAAERQLLLAAVHGKQNRRIAQGHLQEAATIAAEHGMRQLLAPPVRSVLELAQETALEFNDQNLKWLLGDGDSLPEVPDGTDAWNLSRGELQLLAILPGRAKNIEIADLLGVSVNTVKTRLRRLYAKLGAANRDEAIERARERGLLVEFES